MRELTVDAVKHNIRQDFLDGKNEVVEEKILVPRRKTIKVYDWDDFSLSTKNS
jgi:hypothetical protein